MSREVAPAVELALQQFQTLEGRLPPIHPLFSLPLWAKPTAFSNLGNIIIRGSRVVEVVAHSEGKEARKLEGFAEFRGETHHQRKFGNLHSST